MGPRTRTPEQVAAQVAVEAVIDHPDAYDADTRAVVLRAGIRANVADFYLDMLREVL